MITILLLISKDINHKYLEILMIDIDGYQLMECDGYQNISIINIKKY